jgi:hypothetical protein
MKSIELINQLHEIWNTGNLELIENVYAPDFLAHWPASSEIPERRGIDGIRSGLRASRLCEGDQRRPGFAGAGQARRTCTIARLRDLLQF